MNIPELMAPAGGFESLAAALRSGVDSVYFGVGHLNMRSGATANFAMGDLKKIVRLCRAAGVKAYLACNIIVYDRELADVARLLDAAAQAGVDAVIASDPAVIMLARERGIAVHLSVQANVANLESVRFYAGFCDVVVLARELDLAQVGTIVRGIREQGITSPSGVPVRTELFVHGALCVAHSGKCYMSLTRYNASANRGACLQNCRRRYRVTDIEDGVELDIENGYVMSPADLCMIRFIPEIIASGVDVLKLEGRGRSADYVATVTRVYREALDSYARGEFTLAAAEAWRSELQQVFNRKFWDGGYYLGEPLGEWSGSGGNQSPVVKTHIGKVLHHFSRVGAAEILLEAQPLRLGERLLITGGATGALEFTPEEMRVDDSLTEIAAKGEVVTVRVERKVRPNDRVYRLSERCFGQGGVVKE